MGYDVVIVGGGSAGCVLASRLSEAPTRSVLLLEAGPDYKSLEEIPDEIARSAFAPQTHDWGYLAQPDALGNRVSVPRGKVIGGSSSTNYCFAMRARPADHDTWAANGNDGWSYDDLLPFYRKIESYPHGEGQWHGRDGLLHMSRYEREDLSQAAAASMAVAQSLGFPSVDDVNAPGTAGISCAPLSAVDGTRQSTAVAYLNPFRDRPNLTVRGESLVDKVVMDGAQAVGVRLASGEEIKGSLIVLSAGTYNTPAILMRSGIGPGEHLRELGIDVVLDAPGVGQNLTEHPVMFNIYAAKPPQGDFGAMYQIVLSARSEDSELDYDLQLCPTAVIPTAALPASFVPRTDNHPTGWDMVMFVSCVQPKSRGSVTLSSASSADPPVIDLGLYADPADAEKVADAVRLARRMTRTSPLAELLVEERSPGVHVADDDLAEAVRRDPSHYNHACGTAKMGPASDPYAVVDSRCSVHHLQGLAAVDASVLPTIPRVPINPTTIVVAERAASFLAERAPSTLLGERVLS